MLRLDTAQELTGLTHYRRALLATAVAVAAITAFVPACGSSTLDAPCSSGSCPDATSGDGAATAGDGAATAGDSAAPPPDGAATNPDGAATNDLAIDGPMADAGVDTAAADSAGIIDGPISDIAVADATADAAVTDLAIADTAMGTDGPIADATATPSWRAPQSLVDQFGRLAIGNRVHIVGHRAGRLIHRSSADNGVTWTPLPGNDIGPAAGNFPAMYGGLFASGDKVYLVTAVNDMGPGAQDLDFRLSVDNGETWTDPVRITNNGVKLVRLRVAASGSYVHVVGGGPPSIQGSSIYIRSANNGVTWDAPRILKDNLGPYGGGQAVAADGATVHVAYTEAKSAVGLAIGAGPTWYTRSTDNGANWSTPVVIGEDTTSSKRQARVQVAAADGRVFVGWQREGDFTGAQLPADRLGYNTSADGGKTWGTPRIIPENTGINRNHHQIWMAPGGGVHVAWRHGDSANDKAGYIASPDYGATWSAPMFAIDTAGANHPFSIVADTQAVHLLTGPTNAMLCASLLLK